MYSWHSDDSNTTNTRGQPSYHPQHCSVNYTGTWFRRRPPDDWTTQPAVGSRCTSPRPWNSDRNGPHWRGHRSRRLHLPAPTPEGTENGGLSPVQHAVSVVT